MMFEFPAAPSSDEWCWSAEFVVVRPRYPSCLAWSRYFTAEVQLSIIIGDSIASVATAIRPTAVLPSVRATPSA